MQEDRTPKVFISYSWSSGDTVLRLAERLMSEGIEVVLDKWDLREGQDKYAFMEQCVTDPDITKVLMICDKAYAEKADTRTGGVGDETVIISSEVYGKAKQEKFIPVIVERDDKGEPFLPVYIKARVYIDLSGENNYEEEYEKLLRSIYDKPLYSKPKLGKRPDWLDEEKTVLFPLKDLVRRIKKANTEKKQISYIHRFIEEYINTLKTYRIPDVKSGQEVFERFEEMKAVRDVFLEFLPVLYEVEISFSDVICDAFESMYNTLTSVKGFDPDAYSANENDFEIYRIHIWELFICTVAYLRHVKDYKAINGMVTHTYFLVSSYLSSSIEEKNYCTFWWPSRLVEEDYKPKTEYKDRVTLLGDTICCRREKKPVFTGEALAEADLFLYQIRNGFQLTEDESRWRDSYWFPVCYVYVRNSLIEWTKIKSCKFCRKMFELFGVNSIEELKNIVSKCSHDKDMGYGSWIGAAPAILSYIKVEEIGSVN